MPDIILHEDKYPVFSASSESEKYACGEKVEVRLFNKEKAVRSE